MDAVGDAWFSCGKRGNKGAIFGVVRWYASVDPGSDKRSNGVPSVPLEGCFGGVASGDTFSKVTGDTRDTFSEELWDWVGSLGA